MDDKEILTPIDELVAAERECATGSRPRNTLTTAEEHQQLKATQEALDQAWDLLQGQRQSRRESGRPEDVVGNRQVTEVEDYRR